MKSGNSQKTNTESTELIQVAIWAYRKGFEHATVKLIDRFNNELTNEEVLKIINQELDNRPKSKQETKDA